MTQVAQGTSVPAVFNFQSHEVRLIDQDGQPWFVAADVCAALGYQNPSKAVADHLDEDERMTLTNSYSHSGQRGGAQSFTIINESGLYALVLRSRKPEARKFAKWVTSEVLPSIRKTGSYSASNQGCEFNSPPSQQSLPLGDITRPTYYRACREEMFKFMDSLPKGTVCKIDEATQQKIADGFMTDMLASRRWLMSFDWRGSPQIVPVPKNATVMSIDELPTTIRQTNGYPISVIMPIFEACMERVVEQKKRGLS